MPRRFLKVLLTTTALVPLGIGAAIANPLGSTVVAGSATVAGAGTKNVTVTQSTDKAIINWGTFNIGAGETTKFVQPGTNSVTLNRVTGGLGPSSIFGTLTANGQIFLVNPDGMLFGPSAVIDTAGFLGTTANITDTDFMAGRFNFGIAGRADASIVNQGTITAQSGGFAALVAPGVRNSGTITATMGSVGLSSANTFSLDFYGDGLIKLAAGDEIAASVRDVATGQAMTSLVSNSGKLSANGGRVEMTAATARAVVDSVINNTGVIEANSVGMKNGKIVLGAATASTKTAGAPTQTVRVSGTISAVGKKPGQTGGKVQITGESIQLAGAKINASGSAGGGTVLIGGDTAGGGTNAAVASIAKAAHETTSVPNATTVTVDAATTIDASATKSGDGGKVIVWADGQTTFGGTISVAGGPTDGNGGFVETSGKERLAFSGTVDLAAPQGTAGTLLLDPRNVTIGSTGTWVVTPAALQAALAGGDVFVTTSSAGADAGDITVAQGFSIPGGRLLALLADRNIVFDNGVAITAGTGAHVALYAGFHLISASDAVSTGSGSVLFQGNSRITFGGLGGAGVAILDNPVGGYANPTDFSGHIFNAQIGYSMWINNITDLQNVSQNLSGSYVIGRNIDGSATASWNGGAGFIPIGDALHPFVGEIDSLATNSQISVSNVLINSSSPDVGLFGYNLGYIHDLVLTNSTIIGGASSINVGGLAGVNGGLIRNSFVSGHVFSFSNTSAAGGITGTNLGNILSVDSTAAVCIYDACISGPVLAGVNLGVATNGYAHATYPPIAGTILYGQGGVPTVSAAGASPFASGQTSALKSISTGSVCNGDWACELGAKLATLFTWISGTPKAGGFPPASSASSSNGDNPYISAGTNAAKDAAIALTPEPYGTSLGRAVTIYEIVNAAVDLYVGFTTAQRLEIKNQLPAYIEAYVFDLSDRPLSKVIDEVNAAWYVPIPRSVIKQALVQAAALRGITIKQIDE